MCVVVVLPPMTTLLRGSVWRNESRELLSLPWATLTEVGVATLVVTALATGSVTLAAPAISTTPETSRRASVCEPPPSGIRGDNPWPRASATASAIRQMTKCSQATQMKNPMMPSTVSALSSLNNTSRVGISSGHGVPKKVSRTYGTPPTIARIASSDTKPFSRSAAPPPFRCGNRADRSGSLVFTIVVPPSPHPYPPIACTSCTGSRCTACTSASPSRCQVGGPTQ